MLGHGQFGGEMSAGYESSSINESRRRIWLAAAAVPFLACAVLAFGYAYDAPYWDEWSYAAPIVRAFDGELTLSDFVVRVNEHICIVSSLIVIPLARLTHWDLRWEIGVILALYAGIFAMMVRALISVEREPGSRGSLWAAPIIACALFSGSQYVLWNWGLHACLALGVFFSVAAILALGGGSLTARRLVIAGICGWAATYSVGGGLGVWPAGAIVLLMRMRSERRRARNVLAAWFVIGVIAVTVYFVAAGVTPSTLNPGRQSPLSYPVYILAFLGGPLAVGNGGAAIVLGTLLILLLGVWIVRSLSRDTPAIRAALPIVAGLVSAAVAVGTLTALKHAHEGAANAISSRFLPWGTLAWCALAIGIYAEFPNWGLAPRRIRATVAVALIAILASSALGAYKADERYDAFLLGRRALIENPESDDLKFLHPEPESIAESRELLIKHRLTVFRER